MARVTSTSMDAPRRNRTAVCVSAGAYPLASKCARYRDCQVSISSANCGARVAVAMSSRRALASVASPASHRAKTSSSLSSGRGASRTKSVSAIASTNASWVPKWWRIEPWGAPADTSAPRALACRAPTPARRLMPDSSNADRKSFSMWRVYALAFLHVEKGRCPSAIVPPDPGATSTGAGGSAQPAHRGTHPGRMGSAL